MLPRYLMLLSFFTLSCHPIAVNICKIYVYECECYIHVFIYLVCIILFYVQNVNINYAITSCNESM